MTKSNPYTREKIVALIAASLSGQITPQEQTQLDAWLAGDGANRDLYRRFTDQKNLAASLRSYRRFDAGKGAKEAAGDKKRSPRKHIRSMGAYAAAGIILAGSIFGLRELAHPYKVPTATVFSSEISPVRSHAVLILDTETILELGAEKLNPHLLMEHGVFHVEGSRIIYLDLEEMPVRWHTLETPRGGEYRLLLADGTTVVLGPSSRITYPTRFDGGERRVKIEGEAYLDIAQDSGRSFIIHTAGEDILVNEGAFLRSYPDEPFRLAAVSGYAVLGTGDGQIVLKPGQEITRSAGQWAIRDSGSKSHIALTGEDFVFEDELIESILKNLERWYDIHIYIGEPSLKEVRYTGSLPKYGDIAALLDTLGAATGVQFELQGRTLLVVK